MTPRDRIRATVNHRQPDRVPRTTPMAAETADRLKKHLGVDSAGLAAWCGQDLHYVGPGFRRSVSPMCYADPTIEVTADGLYLDIYRVPFRPVQAGDQQYMELAGRPPLANCTSAADLARHPWPDADWWDYSNLAADIARLPDAALNSHSRGFFEISHFMRGGDLFLADLAGDPSFACAIMDRVIDYLLDRARRILVAGAGRFDMFEYNDDVATQRGLFMSPTMWRQLFRPRIARFCDLIHSFGAKVRYHSCGSVRAIIPDLIDVGVDILNPIQPLAAGMDPFELKREFGQHLTFDGGIDTQELLPHSTADQVRTHTRRMIAEVGASGGYILGPSHSLQMDVPVENIVAMIEEANGG